MLSELYFLESWLSCPEVQYCRMSQQTLGLRQELLNCSVCACRFHHGFNNYMTYAFPHDELKPITKGYTDSLGNARPNSVFHT